MNPDSVDVLDIASACLQVGLVAVQRLPDCDRVFAGGSGRRTIPMCDLSGALLRLPEVKHLVAVALLVIIGAADRLTRVAPLAVGEADDPRPRSLVAAVPEPNL